MGGLFFVAVLWGAVWWQFVASVPKPRWVKTLGWPELEGWGCAARRLLTQQSPLLLLAYTRRPGSRAVRASARPERERETGLVGFDGHHCEWWRAAPAWTR